MRGGRAASEPWAWPGLPHAGSWEGASERSPRAGGCTAGRRKQRGRGGRRGGMTVAERSSIRTVTSAVRCPQGSVHVTAGPWLCCGCPAPSALLWSSRSGSWTEGWACQLARPHMQAGPWRAGRGLGQEWPWPTPGPKAQLPRLWGLWKAEAGSVQRGLGGGRWGRGQGAGSAAEEGRGEAGRCQGSWCRLAGRRRRPRCREDEGAV